MGRKPLDKGVLAAEANALVSILKQEGPIHSDDLADELGVSKGHLQSIIKYIRRECESKPWLVTKDYYVISGAQGYRLPSTDEDYKAFFVQMFNWANSLARTVKPVKTHLEAQGVNVKELLAAYREGEKGIYEAEGVEHWFLEI